MTEPTRCAVCCNFTLKNQPHANLEMYRCKKQPVWVFMNPFSHRECGDFEQVAAADLPARIEWEKGR